MKTLFLLVLAASVAACARDADPAAGPSFEVRVAPLTIAGITNACYRVTVTNRADRGGEIVWQEDSLCADDFGDGEGAITYVGPCDADATDANPIPTNSVTIELLDLYTGSPPVAIDDDEYANPCAVVAGWSTLAERGDVTGEDPEDQNGPCTINRVCQENADVLVEFDLTIMRDANQGFFDVAVDFEDIFCSAKLDCNPAFLHDGDGDRNATAIVAFACTTGENQPTHLRVSDLVLSCDAGNQIIEIDATPVAGQHGPDDPGVFQSAVYIGNEQLTSNNQPLDKCYWNRAIGLDVDALMAPCWLSGIATASTAPFTTALYTTEGASYPAIEWNVPVLTADGLCAEHSLDAPGSGVTSTYLSSTLDAATLAQVNTAFAQGAAYDCGGATSSGGGAAAPVMQMSFSLAVDPADPTLEVAPALVTVTQSADSGDDAWITPSGQHIQGSFAAITLNGQTAYVPLGGHDIAGTWSVGQCCND